MKNKSRMNIPGPFIHKDIVPSSEKVSFVTRDGKTIERAIRNQTEDIAQIAYQGCLRFVQQIGSGWELVGGKPIMQHLNIKANYIDQSIIIRNDKKEMLVGYQYSDRSVFESVYHSLQELVGENNVLWARWEEIVKEAENANV